MCRERERRKKEPLLVCKHIASRHKASTAGAVLQGTCDKAHVLCKNRGMKPESGGQHVKHDKPTLPSPSPRKADK